MYTIQINEMILKVDDDVLEVIITNENETVLETINLVRLSTV